MKYWHKIKTQHIHKLWGYTPVVERFSLKHGGKLTYIKFFQIDLCLWLALANERKYLHVNNILYLVWGESACGHLCLCKELRILLHSCSVLTIETNKKRVISHLKEINLCQTYLPVVLKVFVKFFHCGNVNTIWRHWAQSLYYTGLYWITVMRSTFSDLFAYWWQTVLNTILQLMPLRFLEVSCLWI